ncbi:MAG TPA: hypothetical protein VIJ51_18550 [Solirubrobacteraceae bacterium]
MLRAWPERSGRRRRHRSASSRECSPSSQGLVFAAFAGRPSATALTTLTALVMALVGVA